MMIDLGHPLHTDVARAPTVAAPTIDIVKHELACPPGPLGQPVVSVTRAGLPVHFGTHVDAQNHLFADGKPMEAYELDRFIGPATFVDLSHIDDREVTAADLEESTLAHTGEGIVFLVFGRAGLFATDPVAYLEQPWISTGAAQWLIDRGTTMVGMDLLTPDLPAAMRPEGFDFPVHRLLLEHDVLIVENVAAGAQQCVGRSAEVTCAPITLRGADGGHVRPVARLI
ncbi:cyclase family protein [Nocardioides sp. R-C-SC26]|uniref:cyclase family protein n=1 Tax=Nocardioides sp. R-C-SC26 TaxID=2870414 RepID=UPI001E414B9A|nr:cyclase family protein [Nocardioides sp. R-C-SC26]